jgi:hypothetical protein
MILLGRGRVINKTIYQFAEGLYAITYYCGNTRTFCFHFSCIHFGFDNGSGSCHKERIEILQKSSITQSVNPGSDSVYAGKILFEVPGTLLLRLGGPWWFGPSIMLGDCWVNPDWPTPLCECQPNPDGFGMDITVEKGGSSIFHYNGGDYYSLSNTPPPPEFGCGDGPFWAWNYTEDPFYYYNGGVELGPFQVGDEVTITVAVSGCAGLSYRARDTIVSCGNSNFNLAYRLSHPYTDVSCPGISTDWGEYYSDVDLPWILVEIPDMPVLNQNCLVTSVSNTKIHPGEKVGITINQLDCLGNPTPIPPDQVIDLWMNTDARYGKLRCTADSGTSIIGTQPFEFIAADSIDVDSVVVQIQAQLDYGGGGASSIGVGKDTLRSGSIMANVQMKAKNIGDAPNEIKRNGLEYTIDRFQSQLNKASAKKGNEKQQQILTKGIEQLKARLAYQTARTPAAKQSSLAKIQQIAKTSSVQETCNSTADVTIENDCGDPPCGDPPMVNSLPPRDVSNLIAPPQGVCNDPNELGWTTPLNGGEIFPNNTLNNLFSVQVCANRNEKQWKFNLTTVGFLYQTGICESNLTGRTDIGDGTGPNVNAANYCEILDWLNTTDPKTNQPYKSNYYSSNILRLHESIHLDNLVTQFENYLQTFLGEVNSSSVPITDCSESAQSVIDRNKNKLETEFNNLMKIFMKSIDDKYMKDDEAKVQEATKTYFEGLKNIITNRAINGSWPTCK